MAKKKKTGITIETFPTTGQISHLMDVWRREKKQIIVFTDENNRVAEDIAEYLKAEGISSRYFHYEIQKEDRDRVLNDFRSRNAEALIVGSGFEWHSVRAPIVAILDADETSSIHKVLGFLAMGNCATERVIVFTDEHTRELQMAFPSLQKESQQETKSVFMENTPAMAAQDTGEKKPHIDVRDETWTTGTYIVFRNMGREGRRATKNIYSVLERGKKATPGGGGLGEVRWFERWNTYCFFPTFDTVYSAICLREIALFLDHVNKPHAK